MKRQRVFISYNYNDQSIAKRISESLINKGFEVLYHSNLIQGESYIDQIKYLYESSEIVVVLLSESVFHDGKLSFEYPKIFFDEARKRKVTIVPVKIDEYPIPSDFYEFDIITLGDNINQGIEMLSEKLRKINSISFDHLSARDFEELVYDLLKEYDFQNIQRNSSVWDNGIDFLAEYYATNPFGLKKKEVWAIEVKFYRESRFSVAALDKIISNYKYVSKEQAKILLITNGIFTSAVEEYLQQVQSSSGIDINVIDGVNLTKIVAGNKNIHQKYYLG